MVANEADLRALMRASLRGDAAAYRVLLSRLSANLRAYYKGRLARIGRSVTEAEDLTQEALIAIHTRRHTYDPAAPLMPWVHAIARYKLIDHLRHTHASMKDLPIEDASSEGTPMRTDDLIDILSTNVEPVDHRQIVRNIGMAVTVGAAIAVGIVFFVLGPRAGLTTVATFIPALLKVAVTVIILVPASIYLIRLCRPGGERRWECPVRC